MRNCTTNTCRDNMVYENVFQHFLLSNLSTVVPALKTTSRERPHSFLRPLLEELASHFFVLKFPRCETPPAICDHFCLALGVV